MSLLAAKDSAGVLRDLRCSSNGDLLQVTGRLMSGKTTMTMAATTDYAAEDVLSDSASGGTAWRFPNMVAQVNGGGLILAARVLCSTTGLTPRFTLYLFDANPTANKNDNAANTTLLAADLQKYLGKIDFVAAEDLGGYSESLVTCSTAGNLPLPFVIESGGRDLYGILATRDAITGESAGMTITIQLIVELY
jgi:hypothetical protein